MIRAKITQITDWFNRFALHGAMDLALEITALNIYSYGGPNGADELTVDAEDAYDAVKSARGLAPAYTHADLDYALQQINVALYSDEDIDDRLRKIRDAHDAVQGAEHALMRRQNAYRMMAAAL